MSNTELFLIIALAVTGLIAIIMRMAYEGKTKQFNELKRTHVPLRELLGPPQQTTNHDNDFLMYIVRDLLAHQFRSVDLGHGYLPMPGVVDRMQMIAGYLRPYRQQLKALGWNRVEAFINGHHLKTQESGETYIVMDGSYGCITIAVLAETAQVLMNYPSADTIEADIAHALKSIQADQ